MLFPTSSSPQYTVQGKKKVGDITCQTKRPLVEISDQMLGSLQFRTVILFTILMTERMYNIYNSYIDTAHTVYVTITYMYV